jgi:hypothetical protein
MDDPVIPDDQGPAHRRYRGEAEGERRGLGANDRLIAIAVLLQTYENEKSLGDLRPHLVFP